jgi:hypothetical protein
LPTAKFYSDDFFKYYYKYDIGKYKYDYHDRDSGRDRDRDDRDLMIACLLACMCGKEEMALYLLRLRNFLGKSNRNTQHYLWWLAFRIRRKQVLLELRDKGYAVFLHQGPQGPECAA